ncbi:hypothetical protein PR048_007759 [Dryococelus australis]|uniref:Uncharacterized protein n=1 Tax=Dryococelus australis TaxID=614101 RepID=A0ABQ9HV55_9NEOP|nr:hypothetical protein PR048_007759 [Dryococelus australis]
MNGMHEVVSTDSPEGDISRLVAMNTASPRGGRGGLVVRTLPSDQGEQGFDFKAGSLPDSRNSESCLTTPLFSGFSQEYPVSSRSCIPALLRPHRLSRPRWAWILKAFHDEVSAFEITHTASVSRRGGERRVHVSVKLLRLQRERKGQDRAVSRRQILAVTSYAVTGSHALLPSASPRHPPHHSPKPLAAARGPVSRNCQPTNSLRPVPGRHICGPKGREITVGALDKCVLSHVQRAAVGPALIDLLLTSRSTKAGPTAARCTCFSTHLSSDLRLFPRHSGPQVSYIKLLVSGALYTQDTKPVTRNDVLKASLSSSGVMFIIQGSGREEIGLERWANGSSSFPAGVMSTSRDSDVLRRNVSRCAIRKQTSHRYVGRFLNTPFDGLHRRPATLKEVDLTRPYSMSYFRGGEARSVMWRVMAQRRHAVCGHPCGAAVAKRGITVVQRRQQTSNKFTPPPPIPMPARPAKSCRLAPPAVPNPSSSIFPSSPKESGAKLTRTLLVCFFDRRRNAALCTVVALRRLILFITDSPLTLAGLLVSRRQRIRRNRHDGNTARNARRSDEALGERVTVARMVPSLLELGTRSSIPPLTLYLSVETTFQSESSRSHAAKGHNKFNGHQMSNSHVASTCTTSSRYRTLSTESYVNRTDSIDEKYWKKTFPLARRSWLGLCERTHAAANMRLAFFAITPMQLHRFSSPRLYLESARDRFSAKWLLDLDFQFQLFEIVKSRVLDFTFDSSIVSSSIRNSMSDSKRIQNAVRRTPKDARLNTFTAPGAQRLSREVSNSNKSSTTRTAGVPSPRQHIHPRELALAGCMHAHHGEKQVRDAEIKQRYNKIAARCHGKVYQTVTSELVTSGAFSFNASSAGMQGREKREIPEKTRRPMASSGTIPTCDNPGVTRSGIEPGSLLWEASSITTHPPRYHAERTTDEVQVKNQRKSAILWQAICRKKRRRRRKEPAPVDRATLDESACATEIGHDCAHKPGARICAKFLKFFVDQGGAVAGVRELTGGFLGSIPDVGTLRWPPGVSTESLSQRSVIYGKTARQFSALRVKVVRELVRMFRSPLVLPRFLASDVQNFFNQTTTLRISFAQYSITHYDGNTARLARMSDEALGVRVTVARYSSHVIYAVTAHCDPAFDRLYVNGTNENNVDRIRGKNTVRPVSYYACVPLRLNGMRFDGRFSKQRQKRMV